MLSESEKKGKTRKVLVRISSSKIPVVSNFTPKWKRSSEQFIPGILNSISKKLGVKIFHLKFKGIA